MQVHGFEALKERAEAAVRPPDSTTSMTAVSASSYGIEEGSSLGLSALLAALAEVKDRREAWWHSWGSRTLLRKLQDEVVVALAGDLERIDPKNESQREPYLALINQTLPLLSSRQTYVLDISKLTTLIHSSTQHHHGLLTHLLPHLAPASLQSLLITKPIKTTTELESFSSLVISALKLHASTLPTPLAQTALKELFRSILQCYLKSPVPNLIAQSGGVYEQGNTSRAVWGSIDVAMLDPTGVVEFLDEVLMSTTEDAGEEQLALLAILEGCLTSLDKKVDDGLLGFINEKILPLAERNLSRDVGTVFDASHSLMLAIIGVLRGNESEGAKKLLSGYGRLLLQNLEDDRLSQDQAPHAFSQLFRSSSSHPEILLSILSHLRTSSYGFAREIYASALPFVPLVYLRSYLKTLDSLKVSREVVWKYVTQVGDRETGVVVRWWLDRKDMVKARL